MSRSIAKPDTYLERLKPVWLSKQGKKAFRHFISDAKKGYQPCFEKEFRRVTWETELAAKYIEQDFRRIKFPICELFEALMRLQENPPQDFFDCSFTAQRIWHLTLEFNQTSKLLHSIEGMSKFLYEMGEFVKKLHHDYVIDDYFDRITKCLSRSVNALTNTFMHHSSLLTQAKHEVDYHRSAVKHTKEKKVSHCYPGFHDKFISDLILNWRLCERLLRAKPATCILLTAEFEHFKELESITKEGTTLLNDVIDTIRAFNLIVEDIKLKRLQKNFRRSYNLKLRLLEFNLALKKVRGDIFKHVSQFQMKISKQEEEYKASIDGFPSEVILGHFQICHDFGEKAVLAPVRRHVHSCLEILS